MGRIKTTLIKRTGNKLYALHKDKFSKDFDHNKKAIPEVAEVYSKKLRNVLAGYLTRLVTKDTD
ncbi:30S ribosomal protein S17e [archaeon]|jgi:small subunit ribosomal protein S17e|nr:30S ribosomal protein S17e [archaeon]MBT4397487.1 30S ribosomal protein S17e [archaeon]MBT4440882.1 30S ribosomal protein S17e [archaeon]